MPLHNWNEQAGWDGVHSVWIVELLRDAVPRSGGVLRHWLRN